MGAAAVCVRGHPAARHPRAHPAPVRLLQAAAAAAAAGTDGRRTRQEETGQTPKEAAVT